jgi:hypothetical protein
MNLYLADKVQRPKTKGQRPKIIRGTTACALQSRP